LRCHAPNLAISHPSESISEKWRELLAHLYLTKKLGWLIDFTTILRARKTVSMSCMSSEKRNLLLSLLLLEARPGVFGGG